MVRKLLITLTTLFPLSVLADFKSNDWSNEMLDTKFINRYTTASTTDRFGFRCYIEAKEKDFMFTFASNSYATPSSTVEIKIRIDKGKVYNLKGTIYSNSFNSGMIRTFPDELLHEIKKGSELLITIYGYRELEVQRKFSLKGSASAIKDTAGACGVFSDYSEEIMGQVKSLEKERDKKIKQIQTIYAKKISDIKKSDSKS
jgi:hypothetical protein